MWYSITDNWLVEGSADKLFLKMIDFGKSVLIKGIYPSPAKGQSSVETLYKAQCDKRLIVGTGELHCNYVRDMEKHDIPHPHNQSYGIQVIKNILCCPFP